MMFTQQGALRRRQHRRTLSAPESGTAACRVRADTHQNHFALPASHDRVELRRHFRQSMREHGRGGLAYSRIHRLLPWRHRRKSLFALELNRTHASLSEAAHSSEATAASRACGSIFASPGVPFSSFKLCRPRHVLPATPGFVATISVGKARAAADAPRRLPAPIRSPGCVGPAQGQKSAWKA